jgi:Relaxase/Mobilisation nuclease domain
VIIKGKSRAGAPSLAAHLGNAEKNERIELIETRGTVATDLRGALVEMEAYAAGTRCEKSLYHAAISPEPPHRLTREQWFESVDRLETELGLTGHARVLLLHEKADGREHGHIVWSRIDLDRMVSVSDGHNYRKHEIVARELETRFGHERVQGAHHEREGPDGAKVNRPARTPSRPELRQEEKTGIRGKDVRADVTAAYQASDSAEAFKAALEERGYVLAQGDRRDYVVIDPAGGTHSLGRRIEGVNAIQLREFMSPLDRSLFPNVEEAKALQFQKEHANRTSGDEIAWHDAAASAGIAHYEEDRRRRQERTDDHFANLQETAYERGEDYVSQSRAALRDHKRRQRELGQERRAQDASEPAASGAYIDGIEITDAIAARLAQLPDTAAPPSERDDHNRQPEAPGGGRPRSR